MELPADNHGSRAAVRRRLHAPGRDEVFFIPAGLAEKASWSESRDPHEARGTRISFRGARCNPSV